MLDWILVGLEDESGWLRRQGLWELSLEREWEMAWGVV